MAMQFCPACGYRFLVPDTEWGEHDCPRCGLNPADYVEEDEE